MVLEGWFNLHVAWKYAHTVLLFDSIWYQSGHSVSRMTILFQCKSTEPTGHRIQICVVSVVIADGHLTFRDLCVHVCSHTHFISPKRESQRMQKINVECLISAPKHWQVRDSKPIRTTQPLDNSG